MLGNPASFQGSWYLRREMRCGGGQTISSYA